jgi:predicted  nucleic acid-binding Zn-ribbon protein/truncated hemoglobin YjbI
LPSAAVLLEDKRVLHELSESMVDQLNKMYSFFQQVMTHERNRHSSEISLLMRKVDKDLKETFRSVKETFKTLTEQVTMLAKEVDKGRKHVKSLTDKYAQAKKLAQTRGQYVSELEAVVDSHGPKVSEELKRLTEGQAELREELQKTEARYKAREKQLQEENKALKASLQAIESEAKELRKAVPPPLLPEMSSSWTYKQDRPDYQVRSPASGRPTPGPHDPVFRWDAARAVPRTKAMRGRSTGARASPRLKGHTSPTTEEQKEQLMLEMKQKLTAAEVRSERQQKLTAFSSASLLLLKEIFSELNQSGQLKAAVSKKAGDGVADKPKEPEVPTKKPAETLDSIVQMFYSAIPKLGNLSELFNALNEEMALSQPGPMSP